LIGAGLMVAACSASEPAEPTRVLPDAPEPTAFTRAYSMTESPDGLRFYVQEDGDTTLMKVIRPEGKGWSEPEIVSALPARRTLNGPHFSRFDEMFYFSSDAPVPGREGNTDINIWRAPYLGEGQFGEAEPLAMFELNTGANETDTATTKDGTLYFVTNHTHAGGGSYDIMEAKEASDGSWTLKVMPEGVNDMRTDDHLVVDPEGQWMIFYSHRSPKMGYVDLWISERNSSGEWQPAENLGPFLNTEGIEFGAGLSWDGKTFFFSQEGHLYEVPLSAVLTADRTLP
ncbi:MAG: hypothetical protein AAGB19_21810, partial [Cyanobacteria bacterium P01_F01_bin.3]